MDEDKLIDFILSQEDIDIDIQEAVNECFWDLI